MGIVNDKETVMLIPRKDVGRVILRDLRELAQKEYPEDTEAEREQLIAEFLGTWSQQMFTADTLG
jgi:hypothetical protein